MIEEKAKKVIEGIINDNRAQGLLSGVEQILIVSDKTQDGHRKAIEGLLSSLKRDLDFWLAKDITTSIDDLEELVYVERMYETVKVYYDNLDEIGDVKECSIRDLMNEIIYFAGW